MKTEEWEVRQDFAKNEASSFDVDEESHSFGA